MYEYFLSITMYFVKANVLYLDNDLSSNPCAEPGFVEGGAQATFCQNGAAE